jgi:hypothetical protein
LLLERGQVLAVSGRLSGRGGGGVRVVGVYAVAEMARCPDGCPGGW